MFDFFCCISLNNNSNFTVDWKKLDYLNNIKYTEKQLSGNKFYIQALYSTNSKQSNNSFDNLHVFILGSAFTNNLYKSETNKENYRVDEKDIVLLYQDFGPEFIKYIKGIFIVLVFDETTNDYFIYNSRNSLLDAYYYKTENYLMVSSSSLAILQNTKCSLNEVSVLQHCIFDYPLGDQKTLFNEIFNIPIGSYIKYNPEQFKINKYFDYKNRLAEIGTYSWEEIYEMSTPLFNNVIQTMVKSQESLNSALTSGFDSRTVLSSLLKNHHHKNLRFYSWGMPGSKEIIIPQEIKSKLGINYKPIFLDQQFESNYDYFAKQAVLSSDGRGTIRRANHTYGYSHLQETADFTLTGLFGSELIRPINAVDHIFNQSFIDVLFSDNIELAIKNKLNKLQEQSFINKEFIDKHSNHFVNETMIYFKNLRSLGEKHIQLYYFTLNEGFRKYFGHEIHGSRMYMTIQSPYIDDDMVDFILKSPIPLLNTKAFKRNPKTLKYGQLFYLPIIKNNYKKLLNIKTGRYYKPKHLLSFFYPLTVIPGYLKKQYEQKLKSNDTFNNKKWINMFAKNNENLVDLKNNIFNPMAYSPDYNPREIAKHLSLRLFLDNTDADKNM